ncbi:DMT family transporter [Gordonia amicalis]|uniref:SMR family transporter n=1 Tax=Gordonia amicalis TaxID=89053 RepID=A0ABU4DCC6_9ACTN|nr:SMR family transporter [Gordonia amicalis]MDV6307378.1 SMR family transporter [Gordonia amicalis]MDV7175705.1 SMR family transporter [Gordonia amicalis]NKX77541.1 QacE family quaternary ammonium compound efflux SMR transporter [Gordonia amicalis]GAC52603.1 putative drug resistance transporter [Gordonia amicalis NBRC 100051 = JCM 11271]
MPWILLIGAIVSEVAATLSLKGSESLPALYLVVVVGYATAFMLAAVLKRGMGIGVAYGVWSATGVALTAVLASLIFDEAFSPVMAVGIVCIMIGVVLVESGSSSHAPVAAMIDEA